MNDTGDRHVGLRKLCSTDSTIQLQLGASYQDDQHLRDALLNACKNEKWSHRLATMNTIRLLDVEESLSKAITAKELISSIPDKPDETSPAFSNGVNYSAPYEINFSERTGMHYRRYATNRFNGGERHFTCSPKNGNEHLWYIDGKNPIRNNARLLSRQCLSDEHLLRECPKLTPAKRVQLV